MSYNPPLHRFCHRVLCVRSFERSARYGGMAAQNVRSVPALLGVRSPAARVASSSKDVQMARVFRIGFVVLLAVELSGCIFFETRAMRAMRNDPNFKAGYSDGCASANARGTSFTGSKVRDEAAFQVSQPYRAGWSNGYSTCNNQLYRSNTPNVNDSPDQRPNP